MGQINRALLRLVIPALFFMMLESVPHSLVKPCEFQDWRGNPGSRKRRKLFNLGHEFSQGEPTQRRPSPLLRGDLGKIRGVSILAEIWLELKRILPPPVGRGRCLPFI